VDEPIRVLSHLPAERLRAALGDEARRAALVEVPAEGEPPEGATGDVLLTFAWGAPNLPALLARGVRWIHTIGTGVDRFPLGAVGDRILTCARGASAVPIAEWALAVMLAFEKQIPEAFVREPPERWNLRRLGGLRGRTLALLGLGSIAQEVARRALPFGMRVRALRRRPLPSPLPDVELARDLDDLVSGADHLVLAASATAETRRVLDARVLARVGPGLHLVNVSRGSLVDQDALRAALDAGRVARASLDTVDPEPLPAGHWMYDHAGVRLSPHISWNMPGAFDVLLGTFAENLRRYRAGEPLLGVVDVDAGY
jgi:phosphoglycerate dehydrogenase-like enzyme